MGYTYEIGEIDQTTCYLALQSLPGQNEYRLGSVFLRNFYTVLDYEKDLIWIGVNDDASEVAKAKINGFTNNPYTRKEE